MKAVHFGAGNIGRGFIGALLSYAGYSVTFVDVNEHVIDALNKRGQYTVTVAGEKKETFEVKNVEGIHSVEGESAVMTAVKQADLVTTAVGPNVLQHIAPAIAKGLSRRDSQQKVNVIACENAVRATSELKKEIFASLTPEEGEEVEGIAGFADAAVDRIVPNVQSSDVLAVTVEPFYEWVVEGSSLKNSLGVDEALVVDDLDPYIERKLFTVNTGHAAAAYAGFREGYKTIREALVDDEIKPLVRAALNETKEVLIEKYGFNMEEQETYIDKIITRFQNPNIEDLVERVGRGPIRKLGAHERLVKPACMLYDIGKHPQALPQTIFHALHFHVQGDEESERLQEMIQTNGYGPALAAVANLEESHPLIQQIEMLANR
ncbi:mannitol-1-phosphate 5-dehydrogenase [Geomicrobium halophilum]|uniref:Mannitol-1-phosphate 5-dehydrogenase n=1 Tax=Geomicrobium halophilum TaxID=549000 RepID=A0A841PZ50_9BACL|nr:mannitol-1-phosphate 5-dehydrogenase [Geomicrobium halophilum]MBB6449625.1 mannitol-1-phosphate 5-dehydrogenase [Geomicrobium halophilum]